MLSFGFRIFCWYRGFCHRTGSDLLLFLFMKFVVILVKMQPPSIVKFTGLVIRRCPPYPQRVVKGDLIGRFFGIPV